LPNPMFIIELEQPLAQKTFFCIPRFWIPIPQFFRLT
jgi:hypothetical protein